MSATMIKPIYTETAECQDCYKCLRQCSVKAIKIENGHAMIMPELCVACGHCVEICPVGAKRVRNDLERVRRLLLEKKQVIVSLAPSFIAEFGDLGLGQLIAGIKKLGFFGVSETALGAQEVSAHAARLLNGSKSIHISSACPTAVELIKKYYPRCGPLITPLLSPVLAHCKLLRRQYGPETGIVFIGPCIAKKVEAAQNPDLLDAALTFEELRQWWEKAGINPAHVAVGAEAVFIPEFAQEGALYPVDGGMVAGIKAGCTVNDAQFMVFSGISTLREALKDIEALENTGPLFIEVLACKGGCVCGPKARRTKSTIRKRREVLQYAPYPAACIPRLPQAIDIDAHWDIAPVPEPRFSEAEIRAALKRVGKTATADELNCGSCGYDSCRAFAVALCGGRAEPSMCAGHMRKLAGKKADALIRTMPAGIIIVDNRLQIVECNRRFAELIGPQALALYDARGALDGFDLRTISSLHRLFLRVISQQLDAIESDVKVRDSILHASVFTIEHEHLAGGIIQDITAPAVQKERIITKAREVIAKNIATVQQIAYLLGENAADSEVILNSIVQSFAPGDDDTEGKHDS